MNTAIQVLTELEISDSQSKQLSTSPSLAAIMLCGELPVTSSVVLQGADERAELEAFVRAMFSKVHQADIKHFMPKLLSLRDTAQQLRAVCGLRHAHEQDLFLERYFDAPIEQVLSTQIGFSIARNEILEVGNLAVLEPACIRSLLASVSVYLHQTDAKWAVFTGTLPLRNALNKLKMPLHLLGEAKITSLPEAERAAWGRYYQQRPQVIAIPRLH